MATTTPNYGLTKPATTDNYDIEVFNGNADKIDTALKTIADASANATHAATADTATTAAGYTADGAIAQALSANATYQTAGGTGTAITLSGLILADGREVKFIAFADNGGAATTINGIHLYSDTHGDPPKIYGGAAYVAWYSLSDNCFFLRSSGIDTSDATAAAAQILSPYTAYGASGKITGTISTKSAQTYVPGTTDQIISASQYLGGAQTVKGDAALIGANIKNGLKLFQGLSGEIDGSLIVIQKAKNTQSISNTSISSTSGTVTTISITGLTFTPIFVVLNFEVSVSWGGSYTSYHLSFLLTTDSTNYLSVTTQYISWSSYTSTLTAALSNITSAGCTITITMVSSGSNNIYSSMTANTLLMG
jgi:hypothetical protein